MHIIILALISLFFSCASEVKSPKLYSLPPTKSSRPDLVEKTMFSLGLMTDYEIWEFLRDKPSENVVLDKNTDHGLSELTMNKDKDNLSDVD